MQEHGERSRVSKKKNMVREQTKHKARRQEENVNLDHSKTLKKKKNEDSLIAE